MNIPGLGIDPRALGQGGVVDALPWRPTRYEGIQWLDLISQESDRGPGNTSTVLIRMAPGCGYPRHRHLGPEDVLVLAGGYRDDDGRVFRTGDFIRYPSGSEHTPVALGEKPDEPEGGGSGRPSGAGEGQPACILFAVAHGGTEVSGG